MAEQVFKPAEQVPISGVYRVLHNGHRHDHEATLLQGEVFPLCVICHNAVRFSLTHQAVSIGHDKDFAR